MRWGADVDVVCYAVCQEGETAYKYLATLESPEYVQWLLAHTGKTKDHLSDVRRSVFRNVAVFY